MKLEEAQPAEAKAGWKIVRLDSFADLPGEIVHADEETGECAIVAQKPGAPPGETETRTYSLGAGGLSLVRARR